MVDTEIPRATTTITQIFKAIMCFDNLRFEFEIFKLSCLLLWLELIVEIENIVIFPEPVSHMFVILVKTSLITPAPLALTEAPTNRKDTISNKWRVTVLQINLVDTLTILPQHGENSFLLKHDNFSSLDGWHIKLKIDLKSCKIVKSARGRLNWNYNNGLNFRSKISQRC